MVIWRYRPDRPVFDAANLRGRSRCPYCKKELTAVELIPLLSFIIQGGKCRSCGHRLSPQYPIVESLGGAIFLFVPLYLNNFYGVNNVIFTSFNSPHWYYGLVLSWILFFLALVLVAAIDLRHYIVPNGLNLGLAFLGILITAILVSNHNSLPPFRDSFLRHYGLLFFPFDTQGLILSRLIGSLVGGLFFFLLSLLSRGRAMGMGDVKLAFASGLAFGWPDIGLLLIVTFVLGGIWGALLVLFKKKAMYDKIPFAPTYVLGAFLTFFLSYQIIWGYFRLFNL